MTARTLDNLVAAGEISADEARVALGGKKKRSKYGAVRCELDGYSFDSKAEMQRYGALAQLQLVREISKLQVHPRYPISLNGIEVCVVEMDFAYLDRVGAPHVEDVKGSDNPLSRLKRKLFEAYTGIRVELVKPA